MMQEEVLMYCCGHALTQHAWRERPVLGSLGSRRTGTGAPARTAAAHPQASLAVAEQVLRDHISVDVHTHAGPHGLTSRTARPSPDLGRSMHAGGLAILCLADVPDGPLLGRNAQNVLTALRPPEPGLLWHVHLERLAWVDELVAKHGIRRALTLADVTAAHQLRQPAIIMDIEGLDFLEGKLERLDESYQRGVRTMQLVHYTPNAIGDFQMGAVTHNGLTPFGAEVIQACHTLGVVVDVAHGTEAMVTQALRVATKPLLLSHTALRGSRAQGPTSLTERQITPSHARAIAESGGSIGIWHFFPTLEKYVEGVKEMVDVVGVDHVSIGTDASSGQGLFMTYDPFTRLVDAMLCGGFSVADTAKIIGGNYLRIFAACVG
jgi:membrane dipeptidase